MTGNTRIAKVLFTFLGSLLLAGALPGAVEAQRGRARRRATPPPAHEVAAARAVATVEDSLLLPGLLVKEFAGVPLGGDEAAVNAYERDRIEELYRPRILGTPDIRRRDVLAEEQKERVADFIDTHLAFAGQPTGYDASILADEFVHGRGHALRTRRDGDTTCRFFFAGGELWKVLQQIPSAREPFATLAARFREIYGPPTRQETHMVRTPRGYEEQPRQFVWTDGAVAVTLTDHSRLYRSYLARWSVAAIDEREGPLAGPHRPGIRARFRTHEILEQVSGTDDTSADDIVDRLLSGELDSSATPADNK